MLTYTPKSAYPFDTPREYPWALLLMVFVWLWPGVFSHDLWNPREPNLYQVIETFTNNPSHLPMLFENTAFDVAPVYVWLATLLRKYFTPLIDVYAAARITSVVFTSIGLLASGMAAYRLLDTKHQGRSAVLILIGSVGLLPITHFINDFSVLFAGASLVWWAFSVARKQLVFAVLLNVLGLLLLMQAAGLILPLLLLLGAALLAQHPLWASKRITVFWVGSLLLSAPLMAAYLQALWLVNPNTFYIYFNQFLWGDFGGVKHFQAGFSLGYYAQHLLWFAFPALPLALWTAKCMRLGQSDFGVLSFIWLGLTGLFLSLLPTQNQDYLVVLLPVLATLGAAQLDYLRRGVAAFLNWFGIMIFGLAALFLWIGFMAMNFGFPAKLAERAAYFSPYYTRDIDVLPIFFALLFTPVWLIAINRKRIRGRQAITNWAAGVTLVWALLHTLFLPWIDAAKSHRPIVQQMQNKLPENLIAQLTQQNECLYVAPDETITRIAWQQYSNLPLNSKHSHCRYQLTRQIGKTFRQPEHTQIIWQGNRPRNKDEHFVLLEHLSINH